jgi:glyoxylase-like metal-dependent hydrolase (beta-lactamase superfamily II)
MNIVNVGYASANYYVIGQDAGRLLVDVGWPGTLPRLQANLNRKGIKLVQIEALLVTHFHPDHAGLAQEVQKQGVRLIVLETQVEAVARLKTFMKPADHYQEPALEDAVWLTFTASRAFLHALGLDGEIIPTPGHSEESISLVLDSGEAFTGDLPFLEWTRDEARDTVAQSWQAIRVLKANWVYPGHGPVRPLPLKEEV